MKNPRAAAPAGDEHDWGVVVAPCLDHADAKSRAKLDEPPGDTRISLGVQPSFRTKGRFRLHDTSNDLDLPSEQLADQADAERNISPRRA
jgi:hypothetical protein